MILRPAAAAMVLALAGVELAACSQDQTSRAIYDGLRRREERVDVPGEDRRSMPSYDEYRRTQSRPNE